MESTEISGVAANLVSHLRQEGFRIKNMSTAAYKQKIPVRVIVATLLTLPLIFFFIWFVYSGRGGSFVIPGDAMTPTILKGDRVRAEPLSPDQVQRGQVVIHRSQKHGVVYIRRAVALPGDKVKLKGKDLYVNGKLIPLKKVDNSDEPEVQALLADFELYEEAMDGFTHQILWAKNPRQSPESNLEIPPGHLFLLGDHRDNSMDSRYDGPIPASEVFATPTIIFFSAGEKGVRWHRMGREVH